jgi:CRISPR-associated endonuclease Csn1
MRYRLGLSLGPGCLGWAAIRLDDDGTPKAVIRTGVRIFAEGVDPKTGEPLGAERREARARRRRIRRRAGRKERLLELLVKHGFMPQDTAERRALVHCNPHELRARGLDEALTPHEFGRALFHLNQRRGLVIKRADGAPTGSEGAQRQAVRATRDAMQSLGVRTPGEWRYRLRCDSQDPDSPPGQASLSAVPSDGAREPIHFERWMIAQEFDLLWARQQQAMPERCHRQALADIRETLLHERGQAPSPVGRCLLMPQEELAPAALPSAQRLRILVEVNAMRLRSSAWTDSVPLSPAQRSRLTEALEGSAAMTSARMRDILGFPADTYFSGRGSGRQDIRGNATSALMRKSTLFGRRWSSLAWDLQDEIVTRLLEEDDESDLVDWLRRRTGIDEDAALRIARVPLVTGYSPLGRRALALVLPELVAGSTSLRAAVLAAGLRWPFDDVGALPGGTFLPPYDETLLPHARPTHENLEGQGIPSRGRVTDPRLHIALNQVRLIVNALVDRYGRPAEIHAEVARTLKRSAPQRRDDARRRRFLSAQQLRLRALAADRLEIEPSAVSPSIVQRLQLWEELADDEHARRCPYTGTPITLAMVLSGAVETVHILPFELSLDDSLSNKTLTTLPARHDKGQKVSWAQHGTEGRHADPVETGRPGSRTGLPAYKLVRLGSDGLDRWLRGHPNAVSRALDDDYAASHLLRRYLQHLCPKSTQVLGGRQTALLRQYLGLENALDRERAAARDDHRQHAIDACVVGVTDAALLSRLSACAAQARQEAAPGLLVGMQPPWPTFRDHVRRAVQAVWVSHKPEHSHEGAMHRDTAYGLLGPAATAPALAVQGKTRNIAVAERVIRVADAKAVHRHGMDTDGQPRPYKGYKTDSNYCVEIVRDAQGRWKAEVVTTYAAYEAARHHGAGRLRDPEVSLSGNPLVMRLTKSDCVRLVLLGEVRLMRVRMLTRSGRIHLCGHHEANVKRRLEAGESALLHCELSAAGMQKAQARRVTVTPLGVVRDPGFTD